MSRTILTLALASSVSALLPAKVPGRVRGVYSAPLASSALLSMRSRPPYMSIDPDTHTKIAAAGYSSGFSDGLKCASAMVGAPKEAEAGPPFIPPFEPGPVIIPPIPDSAAEDSRCKDAAKGIKGVDGPLLQTLATVCCTIEEAFPAPNLISVAIYEPEASASAGAADAVNDQLDQPFKVTIGGGKAPGDIDALDVFKSVFKEVTVARKDAISGVSRPPISRLQELGTVIDGITDFHGAFYPAVPPFAALVVQPPDDKEVRTLPEDPHPVSELCLVLLRECRPSPHAFLVSQLSERECCPPPAGPHPHPRLARI